jgi:putative glycosyltransferase (TIGR04372 family)
LLVESNRQVFFISLDQHGAVLATLAYLNLWQKNRNPTCLFIFSPRGFEIKKMAAFISPDTQIFIPKFFVNKFFHKINNFYSESLVFIPLYNIFVRRFPSSVFLYDSRLVNKSAYNIYLDPYYSKFDARNLKFWEAYSKAREVMDVRYDVFVDFFSIVKKESKINKLKPINSDLFNQLNEKKLGKFVILNINSKKYINDIQNSRRIHNFQRYDFLINHLISLGYKVILQGSSEQPIFQPREGFIDYAHSSYQSIENDLLIYSNCTFAISSKSGNEMYPLIFNKPILGLNYVELLSMQPNKKFRFYPKHIKDNSGRYLTWKEYLKHPIYFQLGKMSPVSEAFSYEEMCVDELISAVEEFIPLVENKSNDWLKYTKAQRRFRNELHPGHLDLFHISGVPCDSYLRLNKS